MEAPGSTQSTSYLSTTSLQSLCTRASQAINVGVTGMRPEIVHPISKNNRLIEARLERYEFLERHRVTEQLEPFFLRILAARIPLVFQGMGLSMQVKVERAEGLPSDGLVEWLTGSLSVQANKSEKDVTKEAKLECYTQPFAEPEGLVYQTRLTCYWNGVTSTGASNSDFSVSLDDKCILNNLLVIKDNAALQTVYCALGNEGKTNPFRNSSMQRILRTWPLREELAACTSGNILTTVYVWPPNLDMEKNQMVLRLSAQGIWPNEGRWLAINCLCHHLRLQRLEENGKYRSVDSAFMFDSEGDKQNSPLGYLGLLCSWPASVGYAGSYRLQLEDEAWGEILVEPESAPKWQRLSRI